MAPIKPINHQLLLSLHIHTQIQTERVAYNIMKMKQTDSQYYQLYNYSKHIQSYIFCWVILCQFTTSQYILHRLYSISLYMHGEPLANSLLSYLHLMNINIMGVAARKHAQMKLFSVNFTFCSYSVVRFSTDNDTHSNLSSENNSFTYMQSC